MLPACCALWMPVRSTDSGNSIVGVLHSIPGRHRGAERAVPSRSLRRTRLRDRVTPAHPTGERQPIPQELVARPLPGYRTCALIGRICGYDCQTKIADAIPARPQKSSISGVSEIEDFPTSLQELRSCEMRTRAKLSLTSSESLRDSDVRTRAKLSLTP